MPTDRLLVFGPVPEVRRRLVAAGLPTAPAGAELWELRDLLADPSAPPAASAMTVAVIGGSGATRRRTELLAVRVGPTVDAEARRRLVASLGDALRARGEVTFCAKPDEGRGLPLESLLEWGFAPDGCAYPRRVGGEDPWVSLPL
jgi:hypothetical protein